MNIKDPCVHDLARQLAELRGSSATSAVRAALEHELERERAARAISWDRVDALRADLAPSAASWLTDADLYGEDGLPR